MTIVPLPDTPCVRARFIFQNSDGAPLGSRLFFRYADGPASAADLASVATALQAAWSGNLKALTAEDITLNTVDVQDISTYAGSSGEWTGAVVGTRAGVALPSQVAFNLQYLISRRYRGGKPKGYWPLGVNGDLADAAHWSAGFASDVALDFEAFIAACTSIAEATCALSAHVSLSFKHLFTNVANSSGREHAVPTNRATAIHDDVNGYLGHTLLGSQRRRRASTTP